MQKHHLTWAGIGAIFAGFAAIDAVLGLGAVQALADLCLSDGLAPPEMAAMPMEHRGHALPWLALAAALGAVHQLGHWHMAREAARSAWAPERRPILAGLARVCIAQGAQIGRARALTQAYNAHLQPGISQQDAQIALARFGTSPATETHGLMAKLTVETHRAAFLNASLQLLRAPGGSRARALAELDRLTAAMGMTGAEICTHWDQLAAPMQASASAGGALHKVGQTVAQNAERLTAGLAPIGLAVIWAGRILRHGGQFLLRAFIRAVAPPARASGDDQLAMLRRRFKRRRIPTSLGDLLPAPRLTIRRGLS